MADHHAGEEASSPPILEKSQATVAPIQDESSGSGWQNSGRRWLILLAVALAVAVAVGVGAGVGVTKARENSENAASQVGGPDSDKPSSAPPSKAVTGTTSRTGSATATSATLFPGPSATPTGSIPRDFAVDIADDTTAGPRGVWKLKDGGALHYHDGKTSEWREFGSQKFIMAPVVITTGTGTRADFTVDRENGALLALQYRDGVWDTNNPVDLGQAFVMRPAVISRSEGLIDVFDIHTNGSLLHRAFDGSEWKDWESLGDNFVGEVSATTWGPERMDVWAQSGDIYKHASWSPDGWADWVDLGTPYLSRYTYPDSSATNHNSWPMGVSWGPGKLDVVVVAEGSGSWHKLYDGEHWPQNWTILFASHEGYEFANTQSLIPAGEDPAAVLVSRGTDDCVHLNQFNGTGWGFWIYLWCLGSSDIDYPTQNISTAVTYEGNNSIAVVARNVTGDILRLRVDVPVEQGTAHSPGDWAWENLGQP
ncbi:hypothetical protein GQ53DRAFT_347469 [Thozetella sp. PMI_491]|nr:hypothetical protein GQ53DRAFT_347469 [Thozetella sp. PMI_491]